MWQFVTGRGRGFICAYVRTAFVWRLWDVRQKHRLMPPPYEGGGIINKKVKTIMNSTVLGLHPELVSLTAFHKIPECLNFQILVFFKFMSPESLLFYVTLHLHLHYIQYNSPFYNNNYYCVSLPTIAKCFDTCFVSYLSFVRTTQCHHSVWVDSLFVYKIVLPGVNVDESDHNVRIPVVTTAEHLAGIWTDEHRPTD